MNFIQNKTFRSIVYQLIMLVAILFLFNLGRQNLSENLDQRNISSGFGFLSREASFMVSESMIEFDPSNTYARVFLVGILNTLKVSFFSIITAITVGVLVGIFLLSKNWLLRNVCYGYVNMLRNTPLILQLFFWYMVSTEFMPGTDDPINPFTGFFLSNRGVALPGIEFFDSYYWIIVAFLLAIVLSFVINSYGNRKQNITGVRPNVLAMNIGIFAAAILIPWALTGFEFSPDIAIIDYGSYVGGIEISPEFLSVYLGLSLYAATFIAEIVRAGIVSVSRGQTEAGTSIALTRSQLLRLVILPQALRVIIPPLTNQMLNVCKNSTLAVAIGYPDLVSIANTTLNQTGQAIEAVLILMSFYLCLSLLVSLFMNWFNHYTRIVER